MIDTVVLCGGMNLSDWDHHRPLEGPENSLMAEDYWQWIEEQLRQSTYALLRRHLSHSLDFAPLALRTWLSVVIIPSIPWQNTVRRNV